VHRFRIVGAGAGMLRRVDGVRIRQPLEKFLIVAESPGAVQEDERRAVAEGCDLGLDLVLPGSQLARRLAGIGIVPLLAS
jgi:hypothetical protein